MAPKQNINCIKVELEHISIKIQAHNWKNVLIQNRVDFELESGGHPQKSRDEFEANDKHTVSKAFNIIYSNINIYEMEHKNTRSTNIKRMGFISFLATSLFD